MIDIPLMHGWSGFTVAYAAVQAPMLVGLVHARARAHHYVLSPLIGATLTIASGAVISLFSTHYSWLQLAAATSFSAAVGYIGGKAMARENQDASYRRGSLIAENCVSRRTTARDSDEAITVAGIRVPEQDEAKHFKFIGTTGTGKSTAIREILTSALVRGDRAIIADPDGGYLQRFYRRERGDLILNPLDERSVKWDLFSEIRSGQDVEQLARSLIPDHEGQDRSWRGYARTFFTAVTRQAHEAGVRELDELYRLLVVADSGELRGLVRGTPAQPFLEENNSRMFDSIRSVTSSAVGALDHIVRQRGQDFSIRAWVSERTPGVLFIPYKAGQIATLRTVISAWMRLAIFETMEQELPAEDSAQTGNRLWFVVDELDALGTIDGLKDALARLRKFGGRCILGFQSIAQVSSTYGSGDAHTIVENCGNTLILRCSSSEGGGTARFASQLIGEREVVHRSRSSSRRSTELWGSITHSEYLGVEQAVLASEIEQLADLSGYLKRASDPQWQRVRLEARSAWQQVRSAEPCAADTRRSPRQDWGHGA